MSTRRSTLFYGLLIALASVMVGMVLASRLGLCATVGCADVCRPGGQQHATQRPRRRDHLPRTSPRTCRPSVVNIRTESRQRGQELLDFFGGEAEPMQPVRAVLRRRRVRETNARRRRRSAPSSRPVPGSSSTSPGLILTNNHVVEGTRRSRCRSTARMRIRLYAARIVGRDPLTDSALIQVTDKVDHVLPGDQVRRFVADAGRRLGDGDRQPVRLLTHGQRRGRQRHRPRVRRDRQGPAGRASSRPTRPSTPATPADRC